MIPWPSIIAAGAVFAAGFGAAVSLEHKAPWGLEAKRQAANGRAWTWKANAEGWQRHSAAVQAAYTASEAIRGVEQDQAEADVRAAGRSCAARIAEARRQSLAIRTLVSQEAPRDPVTQCPLRVFYDDRQLRDAIQASAAAGGAARPASMPALDLRGRLEVGAADNRLDSSGG